MSDQPPPPPPITELVALKVPFKIGPENLSSNPAAPLRHFFNFHNCFALGDLKKVQVQVGRSVKHELHLTGHCRIMSVCPDTHGNQHVSALDATIRDGAAHIDAQHPATLMSVTISPSGSIMELSIGNPRQVSYTAHMAHSGVAHGGGFIAKFGLKPFQGRPTAEVFAQADLARIRDIEKLLENLKRADANLRDAKNRLESASTALAAFDKMSPEQRSAKESVITQKQKTVSDAQRDIAQIEEIRRANNEHQLTAERTAILSKAPQSVALTMFERGEITWSGTGTHWVYPTIDLHQPHFAVDNAHGHPITRYGKHVDTVSQESGFDMQVTYGHNLFVRHLPGKPISLDVTMDRSSERPTKAMMDKATMFMPLLVHAEAVFKRDDVPFLEMIAEHRIPANCTPQQLSDHLTLIDARWKTLAMRPLPPAHHPHSGSSFWKSKAASPSSSVLVKNLAKRQLLDKLLKLPDSDAGRQRPISSCASLRCSPMRHAPECRGDPMFCPANRAVALTFAYPNHATDLRAQFDLRHELLRASAAVAPSASAAAQASAAVASAAAPKASAAKPKSAKRASAPAASAAAAPAPTAAAAASRKRSSAAPASASKKPKQGGSRTRRRLRRLPR
jgi:hypothetical protein